MSVSVSGYCCHLNTVVYNFMIVQSLCSYNVSISDIANMTNRVLYCVLFNTNQSRQIGVYLVLSFFFSFGEFVYRNSNFHIQLSESVCPES